MNTRIKHIAPFLAAALLLSCTNPEAEEQKELLSIVESARPQVVEER